MSGSTHEAETRELVFLAGGWTTTWPRRRSSTRSGARPSRAGLPIGIQLVANWFGEGTLLG